MSATDPSKLYLGKLYDASGNSTDEKMLYRPEDLNTHCVIAGMTGSGKTGLGITMLEEILLKNIPVIVIDPKGDLTNLMLHFPDLDASDFAPWIDPEAPTREGKELSVLAQEEADKWRNGLAEWGFGSKDLSDLSNVSYTLFTPGSTAGNPVNILSSFNPPENRLQQTSEDLRETISTSVTALLDLIGLSDIDPIQSREHILLSSIIEQYWDMNKPIDIVEMVHAVNDPPFANLGALPLEKVYPAKDRFSLAMLLNNFIASPTFQSWNIGPNLDIGPMLFTADGRARCNIFYLQHLSEHERMFFVTMLYSRIETWMKTQIGTGNLRLAVYFDEISGYLPATANPASRGVIIRMLKQARAFGVGLILSSQNPIDFDYKALSNAGTWMIGRLQTEQDKSRLIDGLTTNAGQINRSDANRLISTLQKRQFLYMNVHEAGLKVFTTRWALNYLAGPLTKIMIPKLLEMGLSEQVDAETLKPSAVSRVSASQSESESKENLKPNIPTRIKEYFRSTGLKPSDVNAETDHITYIPVWYAQAETRVIQPKYNLNFAEDKAAMVDNPALRGVAVRWEDYAVDPVPAESLRSQPEDNAAAYQNPADWMTDASLAKSRESDFIDYIYRMGGINIRTNKELGVYAPETMSEEEYQKLLNDKVDEAANTEKKKLITAYQKLVDSMEVKIRRAEADVQDKTDKASSRKLEQYGALGELALSLLTGRKRSISTSINKYGQSTTANNALDKANMALNDLKESMEEATKEFKDKIEEVENRWDEVAKQEERIVITPMKKDIFIDYFGILWMPYYTDRNGKLVQAY